MGRYNSNHNISSSERSSRTTSRNSENLAMSVDQNIKSQLMNGSSRKIIQVRRPKAYTIQTSVDQDDQKSNRRKANSFNSSSSSSYSKKNNIRETTFNESVTMTDGMDRNDSLTYSGPQPRSRLDVPPHCDASYIQNTVIPSSDNYNTIGIKKSLTLTKFHENNSYTNTDV